MRTTGSSVLVSNIVMVGTRKIIASSIRSLYVDAAKPAFDNEKPFFNPRSSISISPPLPAANTLMALASSPASLARSREGNRSWMNLHRA